MHHKLLGFTEMYIAKMYSADLVVYNTYNLQRVAMPIP